MNFQKGMAMSTRKTPVSTIRAASTFTMSLKSM